MKSSIASDCPFINISVLESQRTTRPEKGVQTNNTSNVSVRNFQCLHTISSFGSVYTHVHISVRERLHHLYPLKRRPPIWTINKLNLHGKNTMLCTLDQEVNTYRSFFLVFCFPQSCEAETVRLCRVGSVMLINRNALRTSGCKCYGKLKRIQI